MSTIKTTNITHGSNSGTANVVLDSSGNATVNGNLTVTGTKGGGVFSSYAVIQDQKANNTAGGTNTQDSWTTRDLNTEVADPDGIVSISSNKFTLGAGNYLVKWKSSFYRVNQCQTRIYDVTNSAVAAVGHHEYFYYPDKVGGAASGIGRLTPSGSTEYRLEYYNTDSQSGNGLGTAYDNGVIEVFATVEIYKEA